jgi:UDP-N-acetylmuramate dehydrogenase
VSTEPQIKINGSKVTVDASTSLDDLALFCAENALEGLNFASGIPGTVGGAICGNAGAFGKQISDRIFSVDLISSNGVVKKDVVPKSLDFSYRDSSLKRNQDVVLSAAFNLSLSEREALLGERREILALRKEKHPDHEALPTAGSFFRNIESTSKAGKRQAAGWYLEQAGAKRLSCNGAATFDKHANIIVKNGECSAQDVYDLSLQMQRLVKNKFDIDLIREVRFVGNFKGQNSNKGLIW